MESFRIPVIAGPTAGGKTGLSIALAKLLGGRGVACEVVSADSMQVYRGLDVGTAKPTRDEMDGVPHSLLDVRDPLERYSVAQWLEDAEACFERIRGRGSLPIVVGGTHLYVKMLLDGMMETGEPDESLRAEIEGMDAAARREELERVDPDAAARIHPSDDRRTVRALEVFRMTGTPISELQSQWDRQKAARHARFLLVGLEWSVEDLNRRINARVKRMIEQGLIGEARGLWERGQLAGQAGEAIGYKQLIEHFEGRCSLEDAVERVKIESRRLGKKQRTWLRRLRTVEDALWLEGSLGAERLASEVTGRLAGSS